MVNIAQSFGGIPTYFIRWNPDDYCPLSDRKHPEPLVKRHKLCGDLIRDIQKHKVIPPPALCAVIYLYYDDWDGLKNDWISHYLTRITGSLAISCPVNFLVVLVTPQNQSAVWREFFKSRNQGVAGLFRFTQKFKHPVPGYPTAILEH
jgi:hypothetical protein